MTQTTKQVNMNRNPEGKGGFQDHPELRNNGGRLPNPMKEYTRERFKAMTPEEKEEFRLKVSPIDQWKMAEGNPTSEDTVFIGELPEPILDVQENNSNQENTEPNQED